MLLNYLYSNFLEENSFAHACGISRKTLASLIDARIIPAPSYIYEGNNQATSFVSNFIDSDTYRFHLKGNLAWVNTTLRLGLDTEDRARDHFFHRYDQAKQTFLSSQLGQQLVAFAPEIPARFDASHAASTWGYFLEGVYGVCTRDGQPETVFLKQAGVMFIEQMSADGPGSLSPSQIELLECTVSLLDSIESDFAPHEVAHTSRQRCITDIRANFLFKGAA